MGAGRPPKPVRFGVFEDENPRYSPDGERIVFCSDRSGTWELWLCRSDGSNPVQLTSLGGPLNGFPAWCPDGSQIAFDSNLRGSWDIYVIKSEGGAPRSLTTDASLEAKPSWSKDGRWIYFCSDRTGSRQIWKMPAGEGALVQVTKAGGFSPAVSPDGKFVYYSKGSGPTGLWRIPAEGGNETPILNDYDGSWGRWGVAGHGIYFAAREENKSFLKFFDFRKRQTADVLTVSKSIPSGALSLSPDGRWLLWAQNDQANADLMLVEDFR